MELGESVHLDICELGLGRSTMCTGVDDVLRISGVVKRGAKGMGGMIGTGMAMGACISTGTVADFRIRGPVGRPLERDQLAMVVGGQAVQRGEGNSGPTHLGFCTEGCE